MLIEGEYRIEGLARERVFAALGDPAILARSVPGCRELVDRGDGVYDLTIDAGVGAVRGSYAGQVRVGERRAPDLYAAVLEASGGPGSVRAELRAELSPDGDDTIVAYAMDATLTGPIAGVGQRVLAGASRRNATLFLQALRDELLRPDAAPPVDEAREAAPPSGAASYTGRTAARDGDADAFQRGVLAGFALALLALLVGGAVERRRAPR